MIKESYQEIRGDVFKIMEEAELGEYQAFLHGSNCFCNMGAGVALIVKRIFPEAFVADCSTTSGDRRKMGSISFVQAPIGDNMITVVNAYTQFRYGRGGPHFEYGALRSCIAMTCDLFPSKAEEVDSPSLIMPMIGAGYAGGDWKYISGILKQCAKYHEARITVVIYDK